MQLRDFVQRQPCIALCADKVTIARRTMDITAIMAVVPDAPKDHMVQSFVVAAPVVSDHSSAGLAEELASSLESIGVSHPHQLSVVFTDGQHHMSGVPSKLLSIMQSSDDATDVTPCAPALWDPSHLLELAHKEARDSHVWISETIAIMSSVTKRHTHGKGLEALLETEGSGKTLRPKLWSDTRFAAHAGGSIGVFLQKEHKMKTLLRDHINENPNDHEARKDLKRLTGK